MEGYEQMSKGNGAVEKRAIFVISGKGGPGKSFFSRGLLDIFRTDGIECAAYDADGGVGSLLTYYGTQDGTRNPLHEQDPMDGVGYFSIKSERERDSILAPLDTQAKNILIDLPGGSIEHFVGVLGGPREIFREYKKEGYTPYLAIVITTERPSVADVIQCIELFGDEPKYVVVKNLHDGDADQFRYFDGADRDGRAEGGAGKRRLEEMGGTVVEMPELYKRTKREISWHRLTFAGAETGRDLDRADRSRVASFRREFRANVGEAFGL